MVIRQTLILILTMCLGVMTQAAITASVDQTQVYLDDSLLLTVSVSPIQTLNDNDLEALQRWFVIEQQFSQQSTQIINGNRSSKVDYRFRLRPKKMGTLGIPNFRAGNEQSQPIFIRVLDPKDRQDALPEDSIILSASVSQTEAYLDQPITLIVELAYNVALKGAVQAIEGVDFEVSVLSEDNLTTTVQNQPYNLYRQTLSLTPKKAGAFSLPDIVFSGEYADASQGRYVRISRHANIPTLTVKPIPASFPTGAFWLPLKNLSLSDNLASTTTIDTGEHIEWVVTTTTDGLNANRLPDPLSELESGLDTAMRLYRNPAKLAENSRTDSSALTVNQAGEYVLPAVRIPWWSTQTDTLQWAELGERRLLVTGTAQTVPPTLLEELKPAQTPDITRPSGPQSSNNPWWKILLGLTSFGWLISSGLALYFYQDSLRLKQNSVAATDPKPGSQKPRLNTAEAIYQNVVQLCYQQKCSTHELELLIPEQDWKRWTALEASLFKPNQPTVSLKEAQRLQRRIHKALNQRREKRAERTMDLYPATLPHRKSK